MKKTQKDKSKKKTNGLLEELERNSVIKKVNNKNSFQSKVTFFLNSDLRHDYKKNDDIFFQIKKTFFKAMCEDIINDAKEALEILK